MTESEQEILKRKSFEQGWRASEARFESREARLSLLILRWQARVDALSKSSISFLEETILMEVIEEVNEILT
jgi:hypothetical protein